MDMVLRNMKELIHQIGFYDTINEFYLRNEEIKKLHQLAVDLKQFAID